MLFFGYIYIFTFSSVTHGFSVWLRNGAGGWMQRVGDVGGGDRWPSLAPTDLTTQPGSLLSPLRNLQWLPLPSAQSRLLPHGAGGPGILHCGTSCHWSSFLHPSEARKVSWATHQLRDHDKPLDLSVAQEHDFQPNRAAMQSKCECA